MAIATAFPAAALTLKNEFEAVVSTITLPSTHMASLSHWWKFFIYRPAAVFAMMLLIVVVLGRGVVSAAEEALPGDLLYPVKVAVVEPIITISKGTVRAQAEWRIQRAQRRLEEAEQLAVQKRLSAAVSAELAKEFALQAKEAEQVIIALKSQEDAETVAAISAQFGSVLQVHADVLGRLSAQESVIVPLQEKVLIHTNVIERVVEEIDKDVVSQKKEKVRQSAENHQRTATGTLNRAEALVDRSKRPGSPKFIQDVAKRLGSAEKSLYEGTEQLKNGADGDAFQSFQKAQRSASEAEVLLRVQQKIGPVEIEGQEGQSRGVPRE